MRALVIAATALVTVSIAGTALAQTQGQGPRSVRDMMADMRARHGQTFEQCQALATSRGYRSGDEETDVGRAVAMFIEGCIMGRQR
jgi:hypothetical protein